MKKRILHIIALLAVLPVLSCIKEEVKEDRLAVDYEGQKVTVYFGVEMPEMAETKALGESPTITSLHVAVFGSSGYLKEYTLAEPVPAGTYVTAEGEENAKGYKVDLSITTSKVRVHLIANGPPTLDFDYESVVMSKLTSSGNQDAYWQRILLDHGIYADKDAEGYYATPPILTLDPDFDLDTDGTTHKMAKIPLIRNFAKVTVVAEPKAQSNFEVLSFAVVNVPDKGSIAPYNSSTGDFMMNYQTYPTLNDLKAVYPGNMPSETTIDKSYPSESDFSSLMNGVVGAGGSVYMYERPVPVSDATIVIVKGVYTDPDDGVEYPGYYKVDLMDKGEYLPILRNFRYKINITKVNRKGKTTVAGAINGAGSADISADISTASQTNISDGKSAISVSFTDITHPIGGTYTIGVSFTPDISNGIVDNSLITYQLLAAEANGAVIASENNISYDASTGTLTYTTTDVDPVHTKSQKIRIIGQSGTSRLYREVTIRLLPVQTMTVSCVPEIEAAAGTAQVIAISIPQDLPPSIFPLQFKIEVAAKSLTPTSNNLPVEPGATIIPGQTGASYQFIKTVSHTEFTNSNDKIFLCEFKSVIAESDSYVYVANPFFATGSTHFVTYVERKFSSLAFSTKGAIHEDDPVNFTFVMDAEHPGNELLPATVHVYLTGLAPDNEHYSELQNIAGNHYVYTVPAGTLGTGTQTFHLLSTGETPYYKVALQANHYTDNEKINDPIEFANPTFGTVYYGIGWPTTFTFTIPNSYDMPAAGYIDIELNLTNLVPNDANITESNGKYYYRATSKGSKTLNFKTATSQTGAVGVELVHSDFVTTTGTQSTRSYLTIANGRITNSIPNTSYPFYYQNNPVSIFTKKDGTNQVAAFTTNTSNNTSATNSAAFTFTGIVDATTKLYLRMNAYVYSNRNWVATTFWASTTAEALYNNGSAVTVTYSTQQPGIKTVTINTTNSHFSSGQNKSYTNDGVTVTFSNLSGVSNSYVTVYSPSTVTVSVPAGYHISAMTFNYSSDNRSPSVTVTSGGGTYTGIRPGTWTASNSTTTSVELTMTMRVDGIRMTSVVVTVEDDD